MRVSIRREKREAAKAKGRTVHSDSDASDPEASPRGQGAEQDGHDPFFQHDDNVFDDPWFAAVRTAPISCCTARMWGNISTTRVTALVSKRHTCVHCLCPSMNQAHCWGCCVLLSVTSHMQGDDEAMAGEQPAAAATVNGDQKADRARAKKRDAARAAAKEAAAEQERRKADLEMLMMPDAELRDVGETLVIRIRLVADDSGTSTDAFQLTVWQLGGICRRPEGSQRPQRRCQQAA